jgi:hypothetical protein
MESPTGTIAPFRGACPQGAVSDAQSLVTVRHPKLIKRLASFSSRPLNAAYACGLVLRSQDERVTTMSRGGRLQNVSTTAVNYSGFRKTYEHCGASLND